MCHEYPVFNLHTRQRLRLCERPLLLMDATFFDEMRVSVPTALDQIGRVADCCRQFGGDLTLLWHNTSLMTAGERAAYRQALEVVNTA